MTRLLNPQNWVHKYSDYLFNFAYARLNNTELAEDIVQETFLAGLKAQKNFEGRSTEKTWLTSILKNKIIDHYRKVTLKPSDPKETTRREITIENFFHEGDWIGPKRPKSSSPQFEKDLRNEEFLTTLLNCLGKVKGKGAEAFKMKYLDELDSEEICSLLQITPSNYWVLIHRTKLQLRDCLEKTWLKDE